MVQKTGHGNIGLITSGISGCSSKGWHLRPNGAFATPGSRSPAAGRNCSGIRAAKERERKERKREKAVELASYEMNRLRTSCKTEEYAALSDPSLGAIRREIIS